jgi:hypothetical protein
MPFSVMATTVAVVSMSSCPNMERMVRPDTDEGDEATVARGPAASWIAFFRVALFRRPACR